ncbi:MAG: uncharacterized protein JWM36_951 [Hyphomicrobiales bacterium]|nr:uncharacterized protein [Hyphomicrobiales bacterium]
MPKIATLSGSRVYLYADDHNPPHFHLIGADWECQVIIGSLQVLRGQAPASALHEAREWASSNLSLLNEQWVKLNERA